MMNDMVVFIPNIIMTIDNSHRAHIWVVRVFWVNPTMPHVRNTCKEDGCFEKWKNKIGQCKFPIKEKQQCHDGIVVEHASSHFSCKFVLFVKQKVNEWRNTTPICKETRYVDHEREELGAIQIEIGMYIVQAVVVAVVNLVVRNAIRVGHLTKKLTHPPLRWPEIKHFVGSFKKTTRVMSFTMDEHVQMSKKPKSRSNSEKVVDEKQTPLKMSHTKVTVSGECK
mmetsp:Transcript_21284/g.31677  ORF Transcript_21284/g.31677 Transcript_21284/m.31677 type:complete len:224 (-) Transcript_21284:537-1208(-)